MYLASLQRALRRPVLHYTLSCWDPTCHSEIETSGDSVIFARVHPALLHFMGSSPVMTVGILVSDYYIFAGINSLVVSAVLVYSHEGLSQWCSSLNCRRRMVAPHSLLGFKYQYVMSLMVAFVRHSENRTI